MLRKTREGRICVRNATTLQSSLEDIGGHRQLVIGRAVIVARARARRAEKITIACRQQSASQCSP